MPVSNAGYAWDFSFLWAYRSLILTGLGVTIAYTIGTILLGLIVGLITGLLRLSRNAIITAPLVAYVEIFRCTPLLVQIVWFYYALPVVIGVDIPAHVAATLVLSLYTGYWRILCRDHPRRRQFDRARPMGRRPRDRHAARPSHAPRDPAAGGQAHDPALHEPVDHPAEEYLACLDDRHCRSALSGHDHHRCDVSALGSLYDGRGDLLPCAVPPDLGRTARRTPFGTGRLSAMIEIAGLWKAFGPLQVLKGVSLQVERGAVVAIIGPSGSGKSTLLRCINLLEDPDRGRIRVGDREMRFGNRNRARPGDRELAAFRASTGMVFQHFNLFPHMTALGNVMAGPVIVKRLPRHETVDIAKDLLAKVGLADKA